MTDSATPNPFHAHPIAVGKRRKTSKRARPAQVLALALALLALGALARLHLSEAQPRAADSLARAQQFDLFLPILLGGCDGCPSPTAPEPPTATSAPTFTPTPTATTTPTPTRIMLTLDEAVLYDKLKGGWIGQMAGVGWGADTEFRAKGRMLNEDEVPVWEPAMINDGFWQDDQYAEIPFLEAIRDYGVNCRTEVLGGYLRNSAFELWHANERARDNMMNRIPAPRSGHYSQNPHCDDIDWQIEANFAGLACPAQVNTAIELAWRTGHVMNYGDGVYGGVLVAAMHAQAYIASSVEEIIEAGRQAVPQGSLYRQVIEDVIAWKEQGKTWMQTWQLLQDKWGATDRCPDGINNPLNIDAKLNGAYVLIGLLYGGGDFERSMYIAMRCGQDSDCNASTVGGILGTWLGDSNIPAEWKWALSRDRKFIETDVSFDEAVQLNWEMARQVLLMNGGTIVGTTWNIPLQQPIVPPILEQWPAAPNPTPQLSAAATAVEGRTFRFTAEASDADGIKAYQWFFGDLSYEDGADVLHTYAREGTYEAVCYVTDALGNTARQSLRVDVGAPRTPMPTPTGWALVDDQDEGWTWRNWSYYRDDASYRSSAHGGQVIGGGGTYTFVGTGVDYYAWRGPSGGWVEVFIDDVSQGTYNLYSFRDTYNSRIWGGTTLPFGAHTLRIEAATGDWTMLDYLRIYGGDSYDSQREPQIRTAKQPAKPDIPD